VLVAQRLANPHAQINEGVQALNSRALSIVAQAAMKMGAAPTSAPLPL
jgi:hypothetical protein